MCAGLPAEAECGNPRNRLALPQHDEAAGLRANATRCDMARALVSGSHSGLLSVGLVGRMPRLQPRCSKQQRQQPCSPPGADSRFASSELTSDGSGAHQLPVRGQRQVAPAAAAAVAAGVGAGSLSRTGQEERQGAEALGDGIGRSRHNVAAYFVGLICQAEVSKGHTSRGGGRARGEAGIQSVTGIGSEQQQLPSERLAIAATRGCGAVSMRLPEDCLGERLRLL